MQKWEYLRARAEMPELGKEHLVNNINGNDVDPAHQQNIIDFLNESGKEGWELVSCEVLENYVKHYHYQLRIDTSLGFGINMGLFKKALVDDEALKYINDHYDGVEIEGVVRGNNSTDILFVKKVKVYTRFYVFKRPIP